MLRPNTILGERFKIVRMIGAGGMATVYEAQHTGIGRRVAVKVLNPSALTNNEIITRFEREARAAGAIGHDNIVEVLDMGRGECVELSGGQCLELGRTEQIKFVINVRVGTSQCRGAQSADLVFAQRLIVDHITSSWTRSIATSW